MNPSLQVLFAILCSLNIILVTGQLGGFQGLQVGYHPNHLPLQLSSPTTYSHNAVPALFAVYAYPVCHTPTPPPDLETVLDFTKKIGDTVSDVGTTLTEIGLIALEDNPEVGEKIMKMLQGQVASGSKVMSEFAGNSMSGGTGKRSKRAAKMDGTAALDKVGDSLTKVMGMIEGDMKKLSKRAQDKISKKNKDALDKCRADSCKAASKLLADADDGERQR